MVRRTKKKISSPIPKKIHFIWLGSKKPPYLRKFMNTFSKYAAGYSIRLWGDNDITKHNFPITYSYIQKVKKIHGNKIKEYTKQKTMYKSDESPYTYSKFAQISDLMRYEIVNREGGYYFDVNMFLVKDITKLFQRKETFIGCNELGSKIAKSEILSNSFFGSIPRSPILKRLLSKSFLDNMDLYTLDVDFVTGPGALRSVINIKKDNFHILPANTFYPYILPWTSDGEDHHLRKSSKPKCTGPKKTKQKTLKMKDKLWLEFPCRKYKGVYGIKIWESGGSWSRPHKWKEISSSTNNMRSVYAGGQRDGQRGGSPIAAAACVPCMAATGTAVTSTIASASAMAGVCAYGVNKAYKCIKTKKKNKKKSKKDKKSSKKDKK